jgi:hypothetical protein
MKLSRQERRILEEIEQHLASEDPELADRLAFGGIDVPEQRPAPGVEEPGDRAEDASPRAGEHPWPPEPERPWPPGPEGAWQAERVDPWSADFTHGPGGAADGEDRGGVLWIWGAVALLTLIAALVVTSVVPAEGCTGRAGSDAAACAPQQPTGPDGAP